MYKRNGTVGQKPRISLMRQTCKKVHVCFRSCNLDPLTDGVHVSALRLDFVALLVFFYNICSTYHRCSWLIFTSWGGAPADA